MDWKLELVAVPVSDVDRAKAFGSACSIYIGTGLTKMKPGSVEGLQMVVRTLKRRTNSSPVAALMSVG